MQWDHDPIVVTSTSLKKRQDTFDCTKSQNWSFVNPAVILSVYQWCGVLFSLFWAPPSQGHLPDLPECELQKTVISIYYFKLHLLHMVVLWPQRNQIITWNCYMSLRQDLFTQLMYAINQGSSSQSYKTCNPVRFSVLPGRQLCSRRKTGFLASTRYVYLALPWRLPDTSVGLGWCPLTQEYCHHIHILQQQRLRVSLLVYECCVLCTEYKEENS